MASWPRLHVYADSLNRYNNLISFRVVNNGRNNLGHSVTNYCTSTQSVQLEQQPVQEKRINRAVQSYLQRSKDYDTFLKEQVKEFEKGKRFLARIMGKDPDTFTQDQINEAIKYLFPSALHEPNARPKFLHPSLLFAQKKEAQFDETGRPFHYLFYTTKPNFSESLHNCAKHLEILNEKMKKMGPDTIHPRVPLDVTGSEWMKKARLEEKLLEKLLDIEYEKFIEAMDRLLAHPYSYEAASFIMEFRIFKSELSIEFKKPKAILLPGDILSVEINGCQRKKCKGTVTLKNPGTGKLSINGKSLIDFFEDLQPRQEVIFPLIFTDMLGKVDIEATVNGEGTSNQAFVVRYGTSMALTAFVDELMLMKMKLAGLLQKDPRLRERDKPGQRGARRKYTWLKR